MQNLKSILFSGLFILISIHLFSQTDYYTVTGKVINAETKAPLQGASVFAENTTLGTATDSLGNFYLSLPNGGYGLVVSFTGFNTQSIRVSQSESKGLFFELTMKEKVMQEVSVVSTGEVKNGWDKYGKYFLEEFIGKTKNSLMCSVKNPEVLKFFFSRKKNRLKILSNEPLVIENKALGYLIKYELDSFVHEYNTDMSIYSGYPLFEEMKTEDTAQQAAWKESRIQAYYGSILHFMRSLYDKKLDEEAFEIQFLVKINGVDSGLHLKDIYKAMNYEITDSSKLVSIQPTQNVVGIIYKDATPSEAYIKENKGVPTAFQFSTILFQSGKSLSIEQNGFYFDQNDITINDYWEWNKMADALPYDFMVN